MKLLTCLLLLCVATLTGCGKKSAFSSSDGWVRFKSPDGPYSVLMPNKPVKEGDGDMAMYMSQIDSDQGVATASIDLGPDFVVSDKKMVAEALDMTMDLLAKRFSGTVAEKKNLIIDRLYPSRDATIKYQDDGTSMALRIRLVVVPEKVIMAFVVAKESESTGPAVKNCLDSIKVDFAGD